MTTDCEDLPYILFWPGIGRSNDELLYLKKHLIKLGFKIDTLPIVYDIGKMPHLADSDISLWLDSKKRYEWWLGLSLGASVACTVASSNREFCPDRLTLINPFFDRIKLAEEKNFRVKDQWPIKISEHNPARGVYIDIIVSKNDSKIDAYHSYSIAEHLKKDSLVELTLIDSDHSLSGIEMQYFVAKKLTEEIYLHE